jgi:hypothetical protein
MSREALLLAVILVVILELLTVGRSDAVLGSYANVSVLCPALVDGALGVGTARLYVHVGIVVHGMVLSKILFGLVVVEVGGGEGDSDLLVVERAGQDDFLVAGLVLNLVAVSIELTVRKV